MVPTPWWCRSLCKVQIDPRIIRAGSLLKKVPGTLPTKQNRAFFGRSESSRHLFQQAASAVRLRTAVWEYQLAARASAFLSRYAEEVMLSEPEAVRPRTLPFFGETRSPGPDGLRLTCPSCCALLVPVGRRKGLAGASGCVVYPLWGIERLFAKRTSFLNESSKKLKKSKKSRLEDGRSRPSHSSVLSR